MNSPDTMTGMPTCERRPMLAYDAASVAASGGRSSRRENTTGSPARNRSNAHG